MVKRLGFGRPAAFAVLALLVASLATTVAPASAGSTAKHRYVMYLKSGSDYDAVRSKVQQAGGKVVLNVRSARLFAFMGTADLAHSLTTDSRASHVGLDQVMRLTPDVPFNAHPTGTTRSHATVLTLPGRTAPGTRPIGDPGLSYRGLQWDYRRIDVTKVWPTTIGDPSVTVGVADTGVDYTNVDLAPNVVSVVDFTLQEDPPLCTDLFGLSDQDLAAETGGPADGDFHGHGSWIAGNIAAALNKTGINGLAPGVSIVSLKIAQWCGFAYDSTIAAAYAYAGDTGIDVVSNSFGGYLDRTDPDQNAAWLAYKDVVATANGQGTTFVASAGNEHTEVGTPNGKVLAHGTLTNPATGSVFDAFGQFQVPAGVPGVVDVSATANVVNESHAGCPPGTEGSTEDLNATCKRNGDPHQAAGQGKLDQLAYYSNYGSRVDVAAPGGARKFNLPYWDRGGTPGYPYTTSDLTHVWEDFSTTSNYATQIPCFTFTPGSGFPLNTCYTAIQGTSMAAPHASAVLALIASNHPELRGDPAALLAALKAGAVVKVHNFTQVTSETDTSIAELTGVECTTGYCHLGGDTISDAAAFGAGNIRATAAK
jgi:subtilisin family serine protease